VLATDGDSRASLLTVPRVRIMAGMSTKCKAAVQQMDDSLGGMFDYSLYDDCIYDESFRRRRLGGDADSPWRGTARVLATGAGGDHGTGKI
jgi:hypothetical protein